jgi:hypothetical protein
VPLGDAGPLRNWADREQPDDHLWREVIREMPVSGTGVVITYEHDHVIGMVDLLLVAGR